MKKRLEAVGLLRAAKVCCGLLLFLSVSATSGFGLSQRSSASVSPSCDHSRIFHQSQGSSLALRALPEKPSTTFLPDQRKGSLLKRFFGRRRQKRALTAAFFIGACWLVKTQATWAAKKSVEQVVTTTSSSALPAALGIRNVALATSVVSCTGVAALSMSGFGNLARSLFIASTRCILQLYLAGGLFLTYFLSSSQPALVWGWIFGTGILAAWEASSRIEYTYKRLTRHLTLSILLGGATVLGLTCVLEILGPVHPWYSARTWIPVSGMLLGNTVTAATLAARTLTRQMATNQDQVELRLARGATWKEAVNDSVLHNTLAAALTPSINALSVTGIVHIPGMMTGQLLAGQNPYQAAAYQVVIFFLITATVCVTVLTLTRLALHALVDQSNHRLQTADVELIKRKDFSSQKIKWAALPSKLADIIFRRQSNKDDDLLSSERIEAEMMLAQSKRPTIVTYVDMPPERLDGNMPSVLRINNMTVKRGNICLSINVKPGDRIALTGASGIGKSQILRTIAGLEPLNRSTVSILDVSAVDIPMPDWRQCVALVPQERPTTLEGTPREFLNEAIRYKSHQQSEKETSFRTAESTAASWGLPISIFDQPWSTLSGGEAQRVSLAIVIALKPDILLLDESMSALDELTALRVEATLKSSTTPIIMVSHSQSQIARFCNRRVELASSGLAWSLLSSFE